MNEQKLLKRKLKAEQEGNKKYLAEICNDLAVLYNESGRAHDALREYKQESQLYKALGSRLQNARSHRMMCEIYIDLDEYEKALKHGHIYLAAVQELKDKIEEQRALATLGRAYLHKGENKQLAGDNSESEKALKSSEKIFLKSLVLCESLKGNISKHELADMRARLLLNIAIVLEHLDVLDKALEFLHKSENICKSEDIFDVLHKCYITEGSLCLLKKNDISAALACFNNALDVASRLTNKVQKQCETLALKAKALCKAADYQSAKHVLLKAWKLNTPIAVEKEEIEKNLKFVAAMCYTEDLLLTSNGNDHAAMKRLYEKMGDGACYFDCYDRAINFYLKMLEHAEKNGEFGKQLVPCYVSLSQTYKDMGAYQEALVYFQKEYDLNSDNSKEAFHSFLNIAECLYLGKHPYENIEEACLLARKEAQKCNSIKFEVKAIKQLIYYQDAFGFLTKVENLKDELKKLGCDSDVTTDEESEIVDENTPSLGDDICVEDITDVSDNEDDENSKNKLCTARRRGKAFTIKKNIKGETQLHQAAISGNRMLAERLISQGHPINIRDNAGWLPIHEACIHGNKEIVELLIQKGANINDRGGTQCDGITPIYDAACNGHLEIIELLLENGASAILKTDFGETALDALQKWQKDEVLQPTVKIFYDTLCSRIRENLEKSGMLSNKLSPETCDRLPQKSTVTDKSSHKEKVIPQNFDSVISRSRNSLHNIDSDDETTVVRGADRSGLIFQSDSSNNSSDSTEISTRKKSHGVNEYRNAILALRNRPPANCDNLSKRNENDKRKKTALLDSIDVVDDWLEDDLKIQSKKKHKRDSEETANFNNNRKSDESHTSAKLKSPTFQSDKGRSFQNVVLMDFDEDIVSSRRGPFNPAKSLYDSDDNSSCSDIPRENIDPSPSVFNIFGELSKNDISNEKKNVKRKWKNQSTLIKAGFSRRRSDSPRNDLAIKRTSCFNIAEPDSTTEQIFENQNGCSLSRASSFTDYNDTSPYASIGICSNSRNQNQVNCHEPQQPSVPSTQAVKVRIMDKLLLIPISLDVLNRCQIKWLIEEAARRYYNIEGVKPTLNLLTSDGAILSEEDPLSLVLSAGELLASVTNWNLPPVRERYIECCQQYKTEIEMDICSILDACQATHILNLTDLSLLPLQVLPILKSINHLPNLTKLSLSNNCLGLEGIRHLVQCLPTLKTLRYVDLSGNCLNAEAMCLLSDAFEKSEKAVTPNLEDINLSYNPIGEVGFKHLLRMTNFLKVKYINVESCDIGDDLLRLEDFYSASLANLESLDVAGNHLGMKTFTLLLSSLNASSLSYLNLDGIKLGDKLGQMLSAFIDGGHNVKIKELNLSRCQITDVCVSLLLRSLPTARDFKKISLQYNPELSVISLKKLVQHSPSIEEINLEGCNHIFKYCQMSDFHSCWFSKTGEWGRIKTIHLTVSQSTSEEIDVMERFCKMWQRFWEHRATVSTFACGGLTLGIKD